MKLIPSHLAAIITALFVQLTTTSCAGSDRGETASPPQSFEAYRSEVLERLGRNRSFQSSDRSSELGWNAPSEWRPKERPQKGVLLVHGLGDSPWTFYDIGNHLATQGFLVRTVLLPGHGTRPEDLLDVKLRDWQKVVRDQAQALRAEVDQVYLGGFSAGANLVVDYAHKNTDVAGLLLFSPGFRSNEAFDWLAPYIAWARPWLLERDGRPIQNVVRYMIVPTNAFAQFYRSSSKARRALDRALYDKPVLMVVAENDSVLDTAYLSKTFSSRFTHPASRLIWYGRPPANTESDTRVLVRTDVLPDLRISQFSHMGIMFSPDNSLYGRDGSIRICSNGPAAADIAACEQGAPVWYSDWGYTEAEKIYARLTFNPYFEWQMEVMDEVLKEEPGSQRLGPALYQN